MLRVRVELDSFGRGTNVRTIGTVLEIANDGTGSDLVGNYNCRLLTTDGRVVATGRVEGHRRFADSLWRLVSQSLENMNYGEDTPG